MRNLSLSLILLLAFLASLLMVACASPGDDRRAGVNAHSEKDFVHAVARFEKALQEDPKDQIAHQYMALSNERLEQYAQAKSQFEWLSKNSETKIERDIAKSNAERLVKVAGPVRPRIVLLSAPWCRYAKRFEPVFNKVASEHKDKVDCVIIDIEKPDRAEMKAAYSAYFRRGHGSMGVPAFVFECKHGSVKEDQFGELTEEEFRKKLADCLEISDAERD